MDKLLRKLLTANESELLDFKANFYNISERKSKTDFVKDLLSMANASSRGNGYIVCGVKIKEDGSKEMIGMPVKTFVDDAPWHQMILKYASHPLNFTIDKVFSTEHNSWFVIITVFTDQKRPVNLHYG